MRRAVGPALLLALLVVFVPSPVQAPMPVVESRAISLDFPDPVPTPTLGPIEEVVPVPVPATHPVESITGIMSWMPEKYGARYLALPEGPGHLVRICAVRCVKLWSMDTGPNQRIHPDRVADLAVVLWEHVCGLSRSRGLCPVTVWFLDSRKKK